MATYDAYDFLWPWLETTPLPYIDYVIKHDTVVWVYSKGRCHTYRFSMSDNALKAFEELVALLNLSEKDAEKILCLNYSSHGLPPESSHYHATGEKTL